MINVVVSLTSFPKRINTVDVVIKSILQQTVIPDKILLYLSEEEFKNKKLPDKLLELQSDIFTINFCDDLKPHKKYFYAMQKYHDSIVITIDDDVIYPKNLVERLLKLYKKYPKAVSCLRAHTIKMYDEETFAPYKKWCLESKIINIPSLLVLPTGVGGILYPPNCLPKSTFDKEKIKKYCLYTDDLWLKWMELKYDIPAVLSDDEIELTYVKYTQEEALCKINVDNNRNDIAWRNIVYNDNGININNEKIFMKLFNEYNKMFSNNMISLNEFNIIKNSTSYKVGQLITFLPRKTYAAFQCYKYYGLKYTLKKILQFLFNNI
jgi:hypothetical protein